MMTDYSKDGFTGNTMIDKPINASDLSAKIVNEIKTNGRLGLSELIANVKPESWTKNDFIRLIESICNKSYSGINSDKIMAACIDSGGPRYQMFTFAFTPITVDYNNYFDSENSDFIIGDTSEKPAIIAEISAINPDFKVEFDRDWVWVFGETYPHKDELKAIGFRWSAKRQGWYLKSANNSNGTVQPKKAKPKVNKAKSKTTVTGYDGDLANYTHKTARMTKGELKKGFFVWDVLLGEAGLSWTIEKVNAENLIAHFEIIAKTPQQAKLRAIKAIKEWTGPRSDNKEGDQKWAIDSAINLSRGFGHKWITKANKNPETFDIDSYTITKKLSSCWGIDFYVVIKG